MVNMDKYAKWLDAGLQELVKDFCNGTFRPQNESDIKCHLYHTLLLTKSQIRGLTPSYRVLSELSGPEPKEAIDLAIVRWKTRKGEFHPRLLVEIKETSRAHLTADKVEEKIKDDIDKLRRYRKMLEEKGKTKVLEYYKTPTVVLFFRGAKTHGIGVRTDREMKKLQKNYEDIILLWGPR